MKKRLLAAGSACLALILTFGIGQHIYSRNNPKEYVSTISKEDCQICGLPNIYRNTEAIGFVTVDGNRWNFDNIGMIQYCQEDYWADDTCYYERVKDEVLEPHELEHKNAPFDINGILKQEIDDESFTLKRTFYCPDDAKRISGTLNVIRKNGLITGAFDISGCEGADADYLCTVLCQSCFDEIYPITRDVNFFLLDCQTGEPFSVYYTEERSFDVSDYTFSVQLRDVRNLIFYATYSEV